MSVLEDIFAGVPEDEVEQMVWGNVIDLYGIDVANL